MQGIKRILFNDKIISLKIAGLILLSYGLVIPFIGFFMDDWYIIWFKHIFGSIELINYFSLDRPLMGYFYVAVNFILGNSESPLVWQVFGLFTRWLCVYALWGFLNSLWPDAKKQNTVIIILASVFPGFTQQWIAVIYCFFFSCLAGFFFSLTLMLKAMREPKRRWIWLTLSLLIGVYSYAAAEFYFGLELIRPIVIWIEISRNINGIKAHIIKLIKYWFPFLLFFISFALWRAFFFVSVNHEVTLTSQLIESPLQEFIELIRKIYQAGVDAVVNSWFNPLNLFNYPKSGKISLLLGIIVTAVFLFILFWLNHLYNDESSEKNPQYKKWEVEAFWLAIVSMIVAILPFWAASMEIGYKYPNDRFLLAYMFGSCLLVVVFTGKRKFGRILVAILVAASTGYQIANSVQYRNMWQQQEDFFWQLTWRAPEIKSGTALISEDLPFSDLFSATSLTAPLNLIYNNELSTHEIPLVLLLEIQQNNSIYSYEPNINFSYSFRDFVFQGNTSNVLVFTKPANGCLRILSSEDSSNEFITGMRHSFWHAAIPLSNLDQIIPDPDSPSVPPEKYFGTENRNQWCYFFEKADLARQQENWSETIQLYDEAQAAGFKPQLDVEWVPLVDAYLNSDQIEKAVEITKNVEDHEQTNTAGFCQLWTNAKEDENVLPFAEEIISWLNCRE